MITVRNMIEWIFDSGEIVGGSSSVYNWIFGSYNSFFNNCKDFACLLYNNYTHTKNHIQPANRGFRKLTWIEKKNPDELF